MPCDLYDVLVRHACAYPKMQPCDAVKLVFQNEFGGGHLIKDVRQSFERLQTEFASITPAECPLTENIGNGLIRLNLRAIDTKKLPLERVHDIIVLSARDIGGTVERFTKKLKVLRSAAAEDMFQFSLHDLDFYMETYKNAGYPVVSHSEKYRLEYKPAYRVVLGRYCAKLSEGKALLTVCNEEERPIIQ